MDHLAQLRAARKAPGSSQLEFLLSYRSGEPVLYLFFEGDDDESFYMNFIIAKMKKGWRYVIYRCGGKDAVYANYRKISWGAFYDRNRVLFFLDKDLSDLIPEGYPSDVNIFVSTFYSFESYLVTEEVLERGLRELCGLTNQDQIDLVKQRFRRSQERFRHSMMPFMAWILLMRRKNVKLNLNNIQMSNLFQIDAELRVNRRPKFAETVSRATGVSNAVRFRELSDAVKELKQNSDPRTYIRGKFDLWLFAKFLIQSPSLVNATLSHGERKARLRTPISTGNAIDVLAPRAPIPPELDNFLAANL